MRHHPVDKGMLGRLGAYDVKVLRRYSPAFLAGFGAQRYDVGVGQGWKEEAAPRMQSNMERHVESSRGFVITGACGTVTSSAT